MTPQILLDALRKAFLRMEMICLIVIDECHRATGNHPYTKIMKVTIKHYSFFPGIYLIRLYVFNFLSLTFFRLGNRFTNNFCLMLCQ